MSGVFTIPHHLLRIRPYLTWKKLSTHHVKVLCSMTAIKVLRSCASGTCSWESQGDPPSYGNPAPASTLPETNIAPENRSSRGKNKRNETKPPITT